MLANPAQADWEDLEAQLAASLFLRTPKPRRPQTSPSAPHNKHQIVPSAWSSLKKSQSANVPPSRPADPSIPIPGATDGHRRPGSTPAMPLAPAPVQSSPTPSPSLGISGRRAAHPEDKTSQAMSWPLFPFPMGGDGAHGGRGGTSSEPSTPRPSPRPRDLTRPSLRRLSPIRTPARSDQQGGHVCTARDQVPMKAPVSTRTSSSALPTLTTGIRSMPEDRRAGSKKHQKPKLTRMQPDAR